MARLLTFLLMLAVMTSHGSLGGAVGHQGPGGHDHSSMVDGDGHGHHSTDESVPIDQNSSDVDVDKGAQSSLGHVHLTADGVPGTSLAEPFPLSASMRAAPHIEAALSSTAVPPLLEPPSA